MRPSSQETKVSYQLGKKRHPFQNHETYEKGDQPSFIAEIEQQNSKECSQL